MPLKWKEKENHEKQAEEKVSDLELQSKGSQLIKVKNFIKQINSKMHLINNLIKLEEYSKLEIHHYPLRN